MRTEQIKKIIRDFVNESINKAEFNRTVYVGKEDYAMSNCGRCYRVTYYYGTLFHNPIRLIELLTNGYEVLAKDYSILDGYSTEFVKNPETILSIVKNVIPITF